MVSTCLLEILQLHASSFLLGRWVCIDQDLIGEGVAQRNLLLRVMVLPSTARTLVTTTLASWMEPSIFLMAITD